MSSPSPPRCRFRNPASVLSFPPCFGGQHARFSFPDALPFGFASQFAVPCASSSPVSRCASHASSSERVLRGFSSDAPASHSCFQAGRRFSPPPPLVWPTCPAVYAALPPSSHAAGRTPGARVAPGAVTPVRSSPTKRAVRSVGRPVYVRLAASSPAVPHVLAACRPRPTRWAVHQVPALHLGGGGGREGG